MVVSASSSTKFYVEPSVSFSIRAFLKNYPYILTMICLLVVVVVFGYAIQTFEAYAPLTAVRTPSESPSRTT